jgi:hypothetical protein
MGSLRKFSSHLNSYIRQIAALTFALTLAWDYFRAPEVLGLFSIWSLGLHFIYFQLPLRSRALAYFQATSFVGANVMLASYSNLLLCKPTLESDHMEQWDMQYSTMVVRAFLINVAPLMFHALDVTANQATLIASYQNKPRALITSWAFFSFGVLSVIYEFSFPDSEEVMSVSPEGGHLMRSRIITFAVTIFAFMLLYMLVIRRAFPYYQRKRSKSFANNMK